MIPNFSDDEFGKRFLSYTWLNKVHAQSKVLLYTKCKTSITLMPV